MPAPKIQPLTDDEKRQRVEIEQQCLALGAKPRYEIQRLAIGTKCEEITFRRGQLVANLNPSLSRVPVFTPVTPQEWIENCGLRGVVPVV